MATLIPDSLVVRTAFAGFLLDVAKRQQSPYFYVISGGNEDAPSSLCHVCGLSDEEFNGLLIAASLASYDIKKDKLFIRHNEWATFIDNYDLSDVVEKIRPTKLDIQSLYNGSQTNRKIRKTYHTLRVGNKAAGGPNNIQDQLDTETGILQPPNITNLRTIQRTLVRMARRAITDEVIHSRVNGMGRQQQQQQRQKQQQQQLQQQSLPVPLPESAPTDNVESPAKRQKQGNAVPATPSPSRPQQLSNICRFLGEDTIDKTDLQRLVAV